MWLIPTSEKAFSVSVACSNSVRTYNKTGEIKRCINTVNKFNCIPIIRKLDEIAIKLDFKQNLLKVVLKLAEFQVHFHLVLMLKPEVIECCGAFI